MRDVVILWALLLTQTRVLALPNLNALEWRELISQPADPALLIYDHCSAVHGNAMYIFGGRPQSGKASGNMVVYDLESRTISTPFPSSSRSPLPRYKCKMAADPSSGLIYMYGGKSKWPKTQFTDFWEYSTTTGTWRELESRTPNAPLYESLDGDLAVIAGKVVVAGADDGLYGKTFRYSIADAHWMLVIEDGLTALNKPLLVGVGQMGYLIGGYGSTGDVSRHLLSIDLSDPSPTWRQELNTGALPLNDHLKGGVLSDGRRIVVYSSTGSVFLLDLQTGVWEELSVKCGEFGPREDFVGGIFDDLLVVSGGATNDIPFFGDVHVFSVDKRGSPLPCLRVEAREWRKLISQPAD
eukprot:Hpha_TRINITY_DN11956_c0_g1::TRINITY_DN11956_c0_g1_i1::g.20621::m.20621